MNDYHHQNYFGHLAKALLPIAPAKTEWDKMMKKVSLKRDQWNAARALRSQELQKRQKLQKLKTKDTVKDLEYQIRSLKGHQESTAKSSEQVSSLTTSNPYFKASLHIIDQINRTLKSGETDLSEPLKNFKEFTFTPKCKEPGNAIKKIEALLGEEYKLLAKDLIENPANFEIPKGVSEESRFELEMTKKVLENTAGGSCPVDRRVLDRNDAIFPYQKLAGYLMWPELDLRGIFLLHPVGSGKTCTAISAINSLLISLILGRNNGITKAWVINPKLQNNADYWNDLKCVCGSAIMSGAKRHSSGGRESISIEFKDHRGHTKTLVINFLVYSKSFDGGKDVFENSLVIFDECHNMMNPKVIGHWGEKNALYLRYLLMHTKHMKLVLASATPIESHPSELALLNLIKLRGADGKPIDPFPDEFMADSSLGLPDNPHIHKSSSKFDTKEKRDQFKKLRDAAFEADPRFRIVNGQFTPEAAENIAKMVRGCISYINIPKIGRGVVYPQIRAGPNDLTGERLQAQQQAVANNNMRELPTVDVIYVTETNRDKIKMIRRANAQAGTYTPWNAVSGKYVSGKIEKLVDVVGELMDPAKGHTFKNVDGSEVTEIANKQVIWANDAQTFRGIAQILEKKLGVNVYFLRDDNPKLNKARPTSLFRLIDGASQTEIKKTDWEDKTVNAWIQQFKQADKKPRAWMVYERGYSTDKGAGTFTEQTMQSVMNKIYNHRLNVHGDYVHGIIIGNSAREGKSFFESTHLHFVDMPPKKTKEELEALISNAPVQQQQQQQVVAKQRNAYNMSMRNQVMGRISRMQSHCKLAPEQVYVRYIAYVTQVADGGKPTAEELAVQMSGKPILSDATVDIMQANALDKTLFESDGDTLVAGGAHSTHHRDKRVDPHGPVCGIRNWSWDPAKQVKPGYNPADPGELHFQTPVPVFTAQMNRLKSVYDAGMEAKTCRGQGELYVHPPPEWNAEHEHAFQTLLEMYQAMFVKHGKCLMYPGDMDQVNWATHEIKRVFNATEVMHSGDGFVFKTRPPNTKTSQLEQQQARKLKSSGETTLFVKFATLVRRAKKKSSMKQWWINAVNNSGEVMEWSLEGEVQDMRLDGGNRAIEIAEFTGRLKDPYFCNAVPEIKPRRSVEEALHARSMNITAAASSRFSGLMSFKNAEWSKEYDRWAVLGRVPLQHWQHASDLEKIHGLALLMRIRGALCSVEKQEDWFTRISLVRAIELRERKIKEFGDIEELEENGPQAQPEATNDETDEAVKGISGEDLVMEEPLEKSVESFELLENESESESDNDVSKISKILKSGTVPPPRKLLSDNKTDSIEHIARFFQSCNFVQ